MNHFAQLLEQLPRDTRACLQAVYVGRSSNLEEIEEWAKCGPMAAHLQRLLELDLVVSGESLWETTWLGRGVNNWNQQLLWAESAGEAELPQPRPEENGDQVVAGCTEYRPFYSSPGYCWCGLFRSEHASEAPKTAAKFLAHRREEERRAALLSRSTGRSILELHDQLEEDQLAALRLVHDHRGEGLSSTELGKALRPRLEGDGRVLSWVDHQVGDPLLERLAELALVLSDLGGNCWYPTFDGAGVANWSAQLSHPAPRPEPRSGENGDWMAESPCDQYRAFLPAPGYCWCGHSQRDHHD